MFDVKKILSRSWHVLWNYRVLWVFGFILALAAGGGNFTGSSNYSFSGNDVRTPGSQTQGDWEGLQGDTFAEIVNDGLRQAREGLQMLQEKFPVEFELGIAAVITFFVVAILFGILVAILRYVAETSTIRMVNEYEDTGVKVGFRQGWTYGWTKDAWRLFGVNLVVHLPVLGLFVVLGLVAWRIFTALMDGVEATIISNVIAGIGLSFLAIFVTLAVMAVLYVLRDFAWRMIVLDGMRAMESLRMAWNLALRQWRNVGVMWLVMVGLKIAWGIAFIVLVIPLLIVSIITAAAGVAAALIPTLLTAGITSLFAVPDYWPWIFAGIVGLPFFFVVAFSPILLVGGWGAIFESSVWTLTYRELKALETMQVEDDEIIETEEANGE